MEDGPKVVEWMTITPNGNCVVALSSMDFC